MDGEKAHLGEARGHVCTLLCKALPIHICEHSLEVSGVHWKSSIMAGLHENLFFQLWHHVTRLFGDAPRLNALYSTNGSRFCYAWKDHINDNGQVNDAELSTSSKKT